MDTEDADRYKIAQAIERFVGRDRGEDNATSLDLTFRTLTENVDDDTCAAILTTLGTEHERIVLSAVVSGLDNGMITELIRLIPVDDEAALDLLLSYFKDLTFRRYYPSVANDFGNIEQLVESARAYREAASTTMLPCTTRGEQLLINFVNEYPQFKKALLERIKTVDDISQEILDQITGHPVPVLVEGVL